jgi:hypothetical protein
MNEKQEKITILCSQLRRLAWRRDWENLCNVPLKPTIVYMTPECFDDFFKHIEEITGV